MGERGKRGPGAPVTLFNLYLLHVINRMGTLTDEIGETFGHIPLSFADNRDSGLVV